MSTDPIIITDTLLNALANLPPQSVDAALTLVPLDEGKHNNQFTPAKPLDQNVVDSIAGHLVRISRGAIALVVIHAVEQWTEAMERHGLATTLRSYDETLDVVVGSRTPVSLPPSETMVMRPLIDALITRVSNPGDRILNMHGAPSLVSLAIKAAGRRLTTIAETESDRRDLENALNGIRPDNKLTTTQHDDIVRRLLMGESSTAIGRRYGKRSTSIRAIARKATA